MQALSGHEEKKRSTLPQVKRVRRVSQQLEMSALPPNLRACFRGEDSKATMADWGR